MVSIIIPAYNAAVFIENCINSLLNQTYQDFEIIVVNDGSTDNTLEILQKLSKKDSRINVLSQPNGGVSSARNTALKVAKGEFITYVDADDTMPKDGLSNMIELMAEDVDFVVASHNEIRTQVRPHLEIPCEYKAEELNEKFIEFDRVVWWPWGKLLRRSVIEDNHLTYDTSITFGEDHIFNLLYAKHMKGKTIVTDKIAYNYHMIRGGLCAKFYPNMDYMQKYVYLKIADYFGGLDSIPREYHKHYVGAYMKGCMDYYISLQPFSKAKQYVEQNVNTYADLMDDEIMHEFFTDKQCELLSNKNYGGFIIDYVAKNPKITIWRKFKQSVKRFLELQQKIFLKRK
jgi:glycosyltransferase involved in cell wall biosynthesis